MAKRSTYHHGNLRRALLDATVELIEECGPEGVTLRGVARRAGVSHAAPYRHFRDKQALLGAAAEEGFLTLLASIEARARRARTPATRLKAWGIAYVVFARRWPARFRLMFGHEINPVDQPEASAAADRLSSALVEQLEELQSAGELRVGEARRTAQVGWAMVHGIAQLALAGQLEVATEKELLALTDGAVELLIRGLRA